MNSYIEKKLTWFLTLLPIPQSQAEAKERIFFFWAILPAVLSPFIFHALRLTYEATDINLVFSHRLAGFVTPVLFVIYGLSVATKSPKLNAAVLVAFIASLLAFTCRWITHLELVWDSYWLRSLITLIVLPLAFQALHAWILYRTSQAICLSKAVDSQVDYSVTQSRPLLFFSVQAYVLYFMVGILFSLISNFSFSDINIATIVYVFLVSLISYGLLRKRTKLAIVALTLYKIGVLFIPIGAALVIMMGAAFAAASGNHGSKGLILFVMSIPILITAYLFWIVHKVQKPLKELYQQNKPVING